MIVVDVETTGLDPAWHSIVSIGAVDFADPTRQFYRECRVWEGAQISPEALAVNGFTVEQVTDPARSSLQEVMAEFIVFCEKAENRTLAGENPSFDRDFLRAAAERSNLSWQSGHRVLDLHSFSWLHMVKAGRVPPVKNGRTALSADETHMYCGLPPEPKPHNGLTGAKMEAESFSRLMYGRGLLEEYQHHPIPLHLVRVPL